MMEKISSNFIANKIDTDNRWLERGVLAIWKFQTQTEKFNTATQFNNGVGFNGADGHFLTSLGNILNKGYHLSPKQIIVARKRMKKYVGQLTRIANAK